MRQLSTEEKMGLEAAQNSAPILGMQCRQRILDQISDPSVRKQLVMRWYFQNEISAHECEALIRSNGLRAA